MLSESAVSPGQEQTFLRWIMGDIDDAAGLKHQLIPAPDLDCGSSSAGTFGLVDPGFGLDPIGGLGGGAVASISSSSPSPLASSATSAGGFGPISSSSSVKVPTFGVGNAPNTAAVFPPVPANSLALPLSLPPGVFYQEPVEEKPLLFGPSLLLSQHQQAQAPQNPAFFLPLPQFDAQPPAHLLPSQTKRHHPLSVDQMAPKSPFADSPGPEFFLRRGQSQSQPFPPLNVAPFHLPQRYKVASGGEAAATAAAAAAQQQQALVEQLFKAAELVEAGNTVSARGILARLNQQLPSPVGKPLLRSAFYFKEALHLLTSPAAPNHPPSPFATPFDVVLKLGTVKAFSDVSPVLQFTNFTSVQALLEELRAAPRIHVVDFDIGVGGQWSAFMQELAQRRCTAAGAASPSLKITAFASSCSHHSLELHLTRENLSHFAADLNIPFEFNLHSLDPFDPSSLLSLSSAGADEAIVVNLPVGSFVHPPVPTLLRLVKQLSPKIVISVDHCSDRSDLPFAQHFAHAFQSYTVLLDSIDAAGTNLESANKIERFLVQPRIENAVLGRRRNADMLPWRALFNSAGFVPLQFSNFAETQAECLLKRVQVRGFHVEKRQASLSLCWQRMELVSVSAWRC
ncbi:scarecrow-like protein 27 [Cocos nucifera]|nr:scarecrow-like protein 27 [Cocos nucifera]